MGKASICGETAVEAAKKSLESKIILNTDAVPPKVDIVKKEIDKEYKCTMCGDSWDTQKNFNKSKSIMYAANNGYVNICKGCRDKLYYYYVDLYSGNEEKAIDRMCQIFDWFCHEEPLSASKQISSDRSRVNDYVNKLNLRQTLIKGSNYIDTIKIKASRIDATIISSKEDIEDIADYKITTKMIKFWGLDYETKAYKTLQGYYDELLKLCEEKPDIKKQKMMKNLCLLEYQMQNNIQSGKDIGTLSNSYKSIFESSGLKNDIVDINKDSYGSWLAMIEKYCPADYYNDENKYRDFFGLSEYIERFMFRPLKNLLTGSKEKEKEFWINDDKDGE